MKPIRYTDAVPPMPEHFRRAMLDTLGGLEPMKRRNKFTLSLAVVVAATRTDGERVGFGRIR